MLRSTYSFLLAYFSWKNRYSGIKDGAHRCCLGTFVEWFYFRVSSSRTTNIIQSFPQGFDNRSHFLIMQLLLAGLLAFAASTAAAPAVTPASFPPLAPARMTTTERALQKRQATQKDLMNGTCKKVTLIFARASTEPGNMVGTFSYVTKIRDHFVLSAISLHNLCRE